MWITIRSASHIEKSDQNPKNGKGQSALHLADTEKNPINEFGQSPPYLSNSESNPTHVNGQAALHTADSEQNPTNWNGQAPLHTACNGCNGQFAFKFMSASDITRIISRLRNTKALGVDGISAEFWSKVS